MPSGMQYPLELYAARWKFGYARPPDYLNAASALHRETPYRPQSKRMPWIIFDDGGLIVLGVRSAKR